MKISKENNLIVNVFFKTNKYKVNDKVVVTLSQEVMAELKVLTSELSICFVTNNYMKKLNARFKNSDMFTDVLAFPFHDIPGIKQSKKTLHGEIIISLDQAKIQANQYKTSFFKEVYLYIIHGILHINGYDDINIADKVVMDKKQQQLFNKFVIDKGLKV